MSIPTCICRPYFIFISIQLTFSRKKNIYKKKISNPPFRSICFTDRFVGLECLTGNSSARSHIYHHHYPTFHIAHKFWIR